MADESMYQPGMWPDSGLGSFYPPGKDCPSCARRGITRPDGTPQRMQAWRAGTIVNGGRLTHVCGRCGRHEVAKLTVVP